jgi:hypothetical protein
VHESVHALCGWPPTVHFAQLRPAAHGCPHAGENVLHAPAWQVTPALPPKLTIEPSSVVGAKAAQPQAGYDLSQAASSVAKRAFADERIPIHTADPQQLVVCVTATQSVSVVHERSALAAC